VALLFSSGRIAVLKMKEPGNGCGFSVKKRGHPYGTRPLRRATEIRGVLEEKKTLNETICCEIIPLGNGLGFVVPLELEGRCNDD